MDIEGLVIPGMSIFNIVSKIDSILIELHYFNQPLWLLWNMVI